MSIRCSRCRALLSRTGTATTPGRGASACWRHRARSQSCSRVMASWPEVRCSRSTMANPSRSTRSGCVCSPPATCWAARKSCSITAARGSSSPATTSAGGTRLARPSSRATAISSLPRRSSDCPSSATAQPLEIDKLLHSLTLFPERCHVVGVYALGKCQRVLALLRRAGYEEPALSARRADRPDRTL